MNYSKSVLIGNWREVAAQEEAEVQQYLLKRSQGDIDVQKVRKLLSNVLKEVKLQGSKEGLKYGDIVQIVSAATPEEPQSSESRLVLSVLVDEFDADATGNMRLGCCLTASQIKTPCNRNAFRIGSYDGLPDGEFLRYNTSFTLSTLPSDGTPSYYVMSEFAHFHSPIGESSKPTLRLTDKVGGHCRWSITSPKTEKPSGTGIIMPNSKVVIRHLTLNENLGLELKFSMKTLFGKEYEVAVANHFDQSNHEKLSNVWFFNIENTSEAQKE